MSLTPSLTPTLETKYANQPLHNFTDCPCAFHAGLSLVHRVAVGNKLFLKGVTVSGLFDGNQQLTEVQSSPSFGGKTLTGCVQSWIALLRVTEHLPSPDGFSTRRLVWWVGHQRKRPHIFEPVCGYLNLQDVGREHRANGFAD